MILEIEEKLPGNLGDFYYPGELKDCFFVHDIEEGPSHVGAFRIIAISKNTGKVVSDCIAPGKKYSLFFLNSFKCDFYRLNSIKLNYD
jgi:hypothetical protein